jgi:hypothetical protein
MNFRIIMFLILFVVCFWRCTPTYYLLTDNINSLKNKDIHIVKIDTLHLSDGNMFRVYFK